MLKKKRMIQGLFFGIFALLITSGRSQIWMLIVFASIALASVFGRFYCGWICPINSVITPIQNRKYKMGMTNKSVVKFFQSEIPRYIFFAFFLIGLVIKIIAMRQGKNFPLPIIVIAIGAVVTIFFNAETWHRYLCPWGLLLSLTSRFSRFSINKNSNCIKCRKCVKICPGLAIDNKINFDKKHCLLCYECVETCPKDAIHYEKNK